MENEPIAIIPKSATQEIRVLFQDYRDVKYCVVRVWYKGPDGIMRPGKDGLNIKLDILSDVAGALTKALAEARTSGLIQ